MSLSKNALRLSVDIDLVYLPMKDRDEALKYISEALDAISADLKAAFKDIELTEAHKTKRDGLRLVVGRNGVQIYAGELAHIAETNVPLEELVAVRERLIELIHQALIDSEKAFLLSFKNHEPDWGLLNLDDVSDFPAIKWKQINLAKMPSDKHKLALEQLKAVLSV
ncbi:nucleotidyl transferase AbiEii/AbiGii toxin family protein [Marinagarivorans algicola]|uniref:nucleotidyl transferase AbiEii/AbiGii toxin family protein n=1 Tax=Marinagarivorans algicola TaxID=1513270 RepID=UPI0012E1A544|nr:nucleotidyl transferase AbiEii/AbiGii toxin family protein [Marinagarivorans algicola]